ncbi:MAG: hypothetical protein AB8H79_10280 [Myxococcota bacterium]
MRAIPLFLLAFTIGCTTTATAPPTTPETPPAATAGGTDAAPATAGTASASDSTDSTDSTDDTDAGTAEAALPGMDKLNEAKGKVHAMMAKAAAMEAVKPLMGEPTTSTDAEATWIAQEGDKCQALKVQLMGDMVGNVNVADAPCPAGAAK